MEYISKYLSPLGGILLAADETGLVGLWFEGQRYFAQGLSPSHESKKTPVLKETRDWLDIYFAGREPDFMPLFHLKGTAFQIAVWEALCGIPYGQTLTYGQIAKQLPIKQTCARAVGSAVGHNPLSILVPCHRVIGADGKLTGYAGGIAKKAALLKLEGALPNQTDFPGKYTTPK